MQNRSLDRSAWEKYFDDASHKLAPKLVQVEIVGEDVGDQDAFLDKPFEGISYDPHDDAIEVLVEGMGHRVTHPKEVYVDDEGGELHAVTIIDADGRRQFVRISAGSSKMIH